MILALTSLRLTIRMQRQSPKVVNRFFFLEFIYANSILLQPCAVYRKRITDSILGKEIWDRLEQERAVLTRGSYYHITDVLSMTEQYAVMAKQQQAATHRASTTSHEGRAGRLKRSKMIHYQTANITLGNKTLKPIIQKGEYDESLQLIIKPMAPTRAPRRIQGLKCFNYLAETR
jgi:hypothetical protein